MTSNITPAIVLENKVYCPVCSNCHASATAYTFSSIEVCYKCGNYFLVALTPNFHAQVFDVVHSNRTSMA